MAIVTTRAVLLRAHPYSESSRVLRFLTEDHGVVGVMGKGVRKGRRGQGLDLFGETSLTLHVKEGRDLQTLRETHPLQDRRRLGGHPLRLAAAGVLAELVLRHHGEAPSPEVYRGLSRGLDELQSAEPAAVAGVLLARGWVLVALLGFHPQVDVCVRCGRAPGRDEMGRFDFEAGGVRCGECAGEMAGPRVGPGARAQLSRLLRGGIPDALTRPRAHLQLLSDFITHHVSGTRPLEAFRMLATFLPPDPPAVDDGGSDEEGAVGSGHERKGDA